MVAYENVYKSEATSMYYGLTIIGCGYDFPWHFTASFA